MGRVPLVPPRPLQRVRGESNSENPNGIPWVLEGWGNPGSLDRESRLNGRRIRLSGREIQKRRCKTDRVGG